MGEIDFQRTLAFRVKTSHVGTWARLAVMGRDRHRSWRIHQGIRVRRCKDGPLPERDWGQVMERKDSDSGSSGWGGADRRVLARIETEERVVVRRLEYTGNDVASDKFYCTVVDISPSGFRLMSNRRLDVGDELEITLRPDGFNREHTLQGLIRWCDPAADVVGFFLGVELVNQRHLRAWCAEFH